MVLIKIKNFEDFKRIVDTNNSIVFYRIESDILHLYAEDDNLFTISLRIKNPEELEMWLSDNFEQWTEIVEVN